MNVSARLTTERHPGFFARVWRGLTLPIRLWREIGAEERHLYVRKDGSMGVCAWCQQEFGVAAEPGESHGICPRHFKSTLAQAGIATAEH